VYLNKEADRTLSHLNNKFNPEYCFIFTQHQMLSKSLTRQASDWILLKKQIAQFDEEYRWSQVL